MEILMNSCEMVHLLYMLDYTLALSGVNMRHKKRFVAAPKVSGTEAAV